MIVVPSVSIHDCGLFSFECFAGLGCSITGQFRAQQIHWVYHKVESFWICSAVKPISLLDPFHPAKFGESIS